MQGGTGQSHQAIRIGNDAPHVQKAVDLAGEPLVDDLDLGVCQRPGVSFALVAERIEAGGDDQRRRQVSKLAARSGEARQSSLSSALRR